MKWISNLGGRELFWVRGEFFRVCEMNIVCVCGGGGGMTYMYVRGKILVLVFGFFD